MIVGLDLGPERLSAVLLDGRTIRASSSHERSGLLTGEVSALLRELCSVDRSTKSAGAVMLSTEHFREAFEGTNGLARTACLRLCMPHAEGAPPMSGWPDATKSALGAHSYLCAGGNEFDGRALAQLDRQRVRQAAADMMRHRIQSVAITAVFSPVANDCEVSAAAMLRDINPDVRVSMSHELGSIGLLERENATIINAALLPLAHETAESLEAEVGHVLPDARLYLTQNDGSAAELSFARHYPARTFWSSTRSALRGGAIVSDELDCVVVDVGLTGTTVGRITDGQPRQQAHGVHVGGVATNLRRPEIVRIDHGTTTGTPRKTGGRQHHQRATGAAGKRAVARDSDLERAIRDAAPASDLPCVVVGVSDDDRITDSLPALWPHGGRVASAVGAAASEIGGEVDRIVSGTDASAEAAVDEARRLAIHKAVLAGAADRSVRIVEVERIPLGYLPGSFVRIRVKALGSLAAPGQDKRA